MNESDPSLSDFDETEKQRRRSETMKMIIHDGTFLRRGAILSSFALLLVLVCCARTSPNGNSSGNSSPSNTATATPTPTQGQISSVVNQSPSDQNPATPNQSEEPSTFGSSKPIPFALKGDIYYIAPETSSLPDFTKLKPVGTIYTTKLEVSPREFTAGFPGVTDRFEWFAIDYNGTFTIDKTGVYRFRVTSDDGSKVFIDNRLVIDNDGIHPPTTKEASVTLQGGLHSLRVQYFQGPRYSLALVLEVAGEGEGFKPFAADKEERLTKELEESGRARVYGINFDSDSDQIKDESKPTLDKIVSMLKANNWKLTIEGHTDSTSTPRHNQDLSERRAASVKKYLQSAGIDGSRLKTAGYGATKPVASNDDELGRAQNRRVELAKQ